MALTAEIDFFPVQSRLYELVKDGREPVIGVGGGRGSAKSSGADRILITLMQERQGLLACLVMRNWDQVYRYHVQAIERDFPFLRESLKTSIPAALKIGRSQLDFSYAENTDDVKRRFQSGNYDYIFIDQAEQFTAAEIREMRKACRSKTGKVAKIVLLFNMRGSGIQDLRKWFYLHEVNKDEDPKDYRFLKVNPWDNAVHVLEALAKDGYTVREYYSWSDEQRKRYAAEKGPYTRQLATDDEVIRKADWEGDWDSIEGAYFANQWDLESTRIGADTVERLKKPWASFWMSQDWGKAHYCATYWFYRVSLSPSEVQSSLGWSVPAPLNVIVTYREMIRSELTSTEIGREMVMATPGSEREKLKSFFLSPDAFGERDSINTIASQEGKELRPYKMPYPARADNDRKGGYTLMGKLLRAAKFHGVDPTDGKVFGDLWLISSECPQLLEAIPMLMRDPKDLDDVLKTDKSRARIEQDVTEAVRYGLKSMLAPKKKSSQDGFQEAMAAASPEDRMMIAYRQHMKKQQVRKLQKFPPSWRGNLK